MSSDRRFLDDEFSGDLSLREAARDKQEDVAFTWRELFEPSPIGEVGCGLSGHALDDAASD